MNRRELLRAGITFPISMSLNWSMPAKQQKYTREKQCGFTCSYSDIHDFSIALLNLDGKQVTKSYPLIFCIGPGPIVKSKRVEFGSPKEDCVIDSIALYIKGNEIYRHQLPNAIGWGASDTFTVNEGSFRGDINKNVKSKMRGLHEKIYI